MFVFSEGSLRMQPKLTRDLESTPSTRNLQSNVHPVAHKFLHDAAFAASRWLARVLRLLHLGNHLLEGFPHVVVQPCASFREAAAEFFC